MRIIYFIVILCSVHFFGLYYSVWENGNDLIDFIFYVLAFLILGKHVIQKNKYQFEKKSRVFTKPIIYLFVTLIVSAISCFVHHSQAPFLTIFSMRYFSYFLVYFILLRFGVDKKTVIKTIIAGAFVYMLVLTIQTIIYPNIIVPPRNAGFSRGFFRLRLEGVGFVTLTGFYALNTFLLDKTKKKYLCLYLLCLIFVLVLGFRTLLLTYFFSSILLVLYINNSVQKIMLIGILFVCAGLLSLQIKLIQDFVFDSIALTQEQISEGDDYIRFLTFDFLFDRVNKNFWSLFFGNGRGFLGTDYGDLILIRGSKINGFIAADLGLIGFVFYYGILSLIAFLNIVRKAVVIKLPKHGIYLKVFFIYLTISSITTSEIYRDGVFGVMMMALYLITYMRHDILQKEGNYKINESNVKE
jgi:hypothetical protein